MKYEAMNVEIICLEDEDILTLSLGGNEDHAGEGMKLGWEGLDWQ